MVYRLTKDLVFPDPHLANPDGLLAIGGDLSPERLILAYHYGIFPWFPAKITDEIMWHCPQERFVIYPEEIHISHSMRNLINKQIYTVTINKAFNQVIENCSRLRIENELAWLDNKMVEAYKKLHQMQQAMSVEVWEKDTLVGGFYGVCAGNVFCGESMFSLKPNTSKLALIAFAQAIYKAKQFKLIDCQFETQHLKSMGGRFITLDEYLKTI